MSAPIQDLKPFIPEGSAQPDVIKVRKQRPRLTKENKEELMNKGLSMFNISDDEYKSFGESKGLELVSKARDLLKKKYGTELSKFKHTEISVMISGLLKNKKGLPISKKTEPKKRQSKVKSTPLDTTGLSKRELFERKLKELEDEFGNLDE